MSNASFYKWRAKSGGMDATMISQMKAMEDENRRLKRIYPDLSMQAGDPWRKVIGPSQRPEVAENAVGSAFFWLATFGVSETCYRYSPLLSDENEEIADLLIGLTDARKTWGFGLFLLHLRNVKGHP